MNVTLTTSGGMQWTMSSYSLDLTSLSFLGLCSATIWAAVSLTYLERTNQNTVFGQSTNQNTAFRQRTNLHFPVQLLNLLVGGEWVLGHLARLHHEDSSPQVPPTPLGDPGRQLLGEDTALLLGHGGDDTGHLLQTRGSHPHRQASRPVIGQL